ncbi:MAG TPA: DUF559 domain-containing protein [Ferruginibacter sp.]|nr:DUF559 domain-containing protein [Ferruginibacter sp.]
MIESEGIKVIRFKNREIMNDKEQVIEKIKGLLHGN